MDSSQHSEKKFRSDTVNPDVDGYRPTKTRNHRKTLQKRKKQQPY